MEEYEGKDGIVGRPIRLNKQRLELKDGKEYAEMIFLGDIHHGHPCCDIESARDMRDYCVDKRIYILGMGDYLEAGTRRSIGDSVYKQKLNPQEQMEEMIDFFMPVADAGLLLGLYLGNHEARILKDTSVNPVKIMAKWLKVPYLGAACWNLFYAGDESYTIYALHGTSSSRFKHTKMKAAIDVSYTVDADIVAYAHVHEVDDATYVLQEVDKRNRTVGERKKHILLTGHYLTYDDSYAQERGYQIGKRGSPKVKLFGKRRDIHVST